MTIGRISFSLWFSKWLVKLVDQMKDLTLNFCKFLLKFFPPAVASEAKWISFSSSASPMMSRMALQVENTNDLAFGSKRWIFKRVLTTDSTLVERLPRTSRFLVISSSCCSGTLLNTNYIKYHCWFTALSRQRLIKGVNRKNWYKILACIVKSVKYPT